MKWISEIFHPLPFKINTIGLNDREKYFRVYWFQKKEPETIAWINTFEPNTVFWDIGANVGCFSLYAACLNMVSNIVAFETLLSNYNELKLNIGLNKYENIIKPEFLGLSDECGVVNFVTECMEPGSSGGQIGKTNDFDAKNELSVNVITGDEYARLNGVPNYIKIDIDGQEDRVLKGMEGVLHDNTLKSVLIEDTESGNIHKIMQELGFHIDEKLEKLKTRDRDFNRIYRR